MTAVSKSVAASEVAASFPDNTTGLITPTGTRNVLLDLIDSYIDVLTPGASTGSMLYWPAASTNPVSMALSAPGSLMVAGASAPSWVTVASAPGALPFYSTASQVSGIALSAVGSLLVAGASAPSWVTVASAAGAIPYFATASQLTGLALSAAGSILQAGVSAPSWLAPGSRGSLLYEISASSAAWLALGTTGSILQPAASAPVWTVNPLLGQPGTAAGSLGIAGSNSTSTVTLFANASGASWPLVFPPSLGSTGFLLSVNSAGGTSWVNGGQVPGDPTGAAASSGNIGEYITATVAIGSAVALTSGVTSNVTSIGLTAGDWDISTNVFTNVGGTLTLLETGWNTTTATLPTRGTGRSVLFNGSVAGNIGQSTARSRIAVSSATSIFFVAQSVFTVSNAGYGTIEARRCR